MERVVVFGGALLALPIVLAIGARRVQPRSFSASPASGPVLVITPGEARDQPPPEAISLALRAMTPAMRASLASALDDLDIDIDVASNPFAEPLNDGPPGAALEAVAKTLLPAITAAEGLARSTYAVKGGIGTVEKSCPPHAKCVPLWRPGDEGARFAAWAWANAAVLNADDASIAALRVRAESNSTIALVVAASDLSNEPSDVAAIRERGVALDARLRKHGTPPKLVSLLARAPSSVTIPIDAGTVIVVPRLGALSRLGAFAAELRSAAPRARWVRMP